MKLLTECMVENIYNVGMTFYFSNEEIKTVLNRVLKLRILTIFRSSRPEVDSFCSFFNKTIFIIFQRFECYYNNCQRTDLH